MKPPLLILNILLLSLIVTHSVIRDIKLESHYPSDLRNRVVGARMQKDGKLPYSYAWHPADGIRYYDPANHNEGRGTSDVTASPFFHQLFIPFVEWPQRTISKAYLIFEYLLLAGIILMACRMTHNRNLQWIIVNAGILFTLTEAWKDQVGGGQLYLFEGFLMGTIFFALSSDKKRTLEIAGILSAIFVLTRPIAIVMFIPFLIHFKRYFRFFLVAGLSICFYAIFVITSPYQRDLYQDYIKNMKIHTLAHQQLLPPDLAVGIIWGDTIPNLEGFDSRKTSELTAKDNIKIYSESASIFVVYDKLTHSKLPVYILNIASATILSILTLIFFLRTKRYQPDALQIALLGFLMYMIVELFVPIHRHQYNTVQWFPLVLTGLLFVRRWNTPEGILLFLGLLLNISNTQWIPMRHMIGEMCWLTALLIIVFLPPKNPNTWKLPS